MTIPNHFALGLIIGKVTGSYEIAIATSVLLDCDHFVALYRHGKLKTLKLFWKAITNREDSFSDQRGALHNLFSVVITTSISYFLFGSPVALVVGLSHLGHIFLDILSNADSWPFRPFSNFRIRGLIPYYSKFEVLFFFGLLFSFFLF